MEWAKFSSELEFDSFLTFSRTITVDLRSAQARNNRGRCGLAHDNRGEPTATAAGLHSNRTSGGKVRGDGKSFKNCFLVAKTAEETTTLPTCRDIGHAGKLAG